MVGRTQLKLFMILVAVTAAAEETWQASHKRALQALQEQNYSLAQKELESALESPAGTLPPMGRAVLLRLLGNALKFQEKYKVAEQKYRESLAILEKAGKDTPQTANVLNDLSECLKNERRFKEAEAFGRRALAIGEQLPANNERPVVQSLNNLAAIYEQQGRFSEAEPLKLRALEMREKSLGGDQPGIAPLIYGLADLYYLDGKYDAAVPLLQRALAIRGKEAGSDNAMAAVTLSRLADISHDEGRFAEAESYRRRALSSSERRTGGKDLHTAGFLRLLASDLREQAKYKEAEATLERAAPLAVENGARTPVFWMVQDELAAVCLDTGRYREAAELLERFTAPAEKEGRAETWLQAAVLVDLAEAYRRLGRTAEAESLLLKAVDVMGSNGREQMVALRVLRLASVFRDERKFDQSEPMFRQALAMTERTPQSPLRADVLEEFGNLCRDWNRAAEAESLYQRALELTVESRGKDHPKYARLLDDMAVLAIAQRKFDEASKLLSTARMIEIERLGPDNGQLAGNLWHSAVLERARGTAATAQPLFERSIAILEKTDGDSSPALKPVLADYAALLKKMGRLRDANRVEARAATLK